MQEKTKTMKQLLAAQGIKCSKIVIAVFAAILYSGQTKAQSSAKWITPDWANQLKNPIAGNTAVLKNARALYISNCAPCHGNNGKGDGIAAAALNPKPADHTSAAVQKETDGALFWKMTEGHTPMPTYKQTLTETQRWQLVNFIRSLGKHK